MNLKTILLIVIASFTLNACKPAAKSILVIGDSWNVFMCSYSSFDNALLAANIQNAATHPTCNLTTRFGMRAARWLDSNFHKATLVALKDKSIKVLYISLGGNDLLNAWNKNLNASQEQEVFENLKSDLNKIIALYQKERPDIKILISGYDFPRFIPNHPISAYKKAYEDMGSPTPVELNSAMIRMSESLKKIADQKSVFYIQHHGLMQYYLGNKVDGLQPLTTLSPEFISSADQPDRAGGDKNLLSDASAMLQAGPATDAFHLNQFGYNKIAEHVVNIYLKDWLK